MDHQQSANNCHPLPSRLCGQHAPWRLTRTDGIGRYSIGLTIPWKVQTTRRKKCMQSLFKVPAEKPIYKHSYFWGQSYKEKSFIRFFLDLILSQFFVPTLSVDHWCQIKSSFFNFAVGKIFATNIKIQRHNFLKLSYDHS